MLEEVSLHLTQLVICKLLSLMCSGTSIGPKKSIWATDLYSPFHHWPKVTLTSLLEHIHEWLKVAMATFNRCISLTQMDPDISLTYIIANEKWMAYGQFLCSQRLGRKRQEQVILSLPIGINGIISILEWRNLEISPNGDDLKIHLPRIWEEGRIYSVI